MATSRDNELGARMMLTELALRLNSADDEIDLAHPGLTEEDGLKLVGVKAILEGLIQKLAEMGAGQAP